MFRGKPGSFLAKLNSRLTRTIVTGSENLSALGKSGPALMILNHTTIVDVVVTVGALHKLGYTVDGQCKDVCTHMRHLRPIGTSDIWNYSFARRIVQGSGIIPTDQHDGRSAYRDAIRALDNGQCVLIYPEGDVKVNDNASPRPWRPGAVALAKSRPMPIVPIAHHDSRRLGSGTVIRSIVLALTKFIWRPKIHLNIGRPILPEELYGKTPLEIGQIMFDRLVETWQQAVLANR
jgi:1-acyl-sn-glycerol-3-phosphate acyltransferase